MPWCQFLIDERDQERTFQRHLAVLPERGDVVEIGDERVIVTSVAPIPSRAHIAVSPTALVFCTPRLVADLELL
jgi:hypothetical protein